MKSECIECRVKTNQNILFEHKEPIIRHEEDGWWAQTTWQIIQCAGCDSISFRHLYTDADFQDYETEDEVYFEELYPKRSKIGEQEYRAVPKQIRDILQQTLEAFDAQSNLLAAAGIRTVLEAICNDKEISGGTLEKINKLGEITNKRYNNLEGKIQGLLENGYLSANNSDILHGLRFLGNEALHKLYNPKDKELELSIQIINHILENIYEIRSKATSLSKERAKRIK